MVLRRPSVLTCSPSNCPSTRFFPPLMRLLRPFLLIPLDEPVFLWYSSFWVQLQLIPGSRLCPFTPRNTYECAQFWCNVSLLDATLIGSLVYVANKGLAQCFKSLRCNTYKKMGGVPPRCCYLGTGRKPGDF